MDKSTLLQNSTNEKAIDATNLFINNIASAIANQVANQLANQVAPLLNTDKSETQDKLLNIDEACKVLHLEKPTVYSKVSRGELPHMKKGKRLYFSHEALLEYIHSGRVKTNDELAESALDYLNIRKGGVSNGK
ncbi:helix-turn-helix domain-containing protein [Carboxylicivirga sp. N1Y90]|uniref:helix-turn-helix domain-containing protein n=1 Tax=Carboxylicivirga fragile TaxID=3417571 RepID=UPI003D336916|nr:helix-turn-helix domain-containing protein [Marinilabiliaceae bacterium N1Y90]